MREDEDEAEEDGAEVEEEEKQEEEEEFAMQYLGDAGDLVGEEWCGVRVQFHCCG